MFRFVSNVTEPSLGEQSSIGTQNRCDFGGKKIIIYINNIWTKEYFILENIPYQNLN